MLDVDDLLNKMVNASKESLGDNWPAISNLATSSLKSLAQNIVSIEEMKVANTISLAQAQLLLEMQKNTARTVLLTEEGLGLLAAQAAINAAIDVVKVAVNTATGWGLL
jgi:hypothetical protein